MVRHHQLLTLVFEELSENHTLNFLKTTHIPLNFRIIRLKLFLFCQYYTCSSCTSFFSFVAAKLYRLYYKETLKWCNCIIVCKH